MHWGIVYSVRFVFFIVKLGHRPIPSPTRQQVTLKVARMLAVNTGTAVYYALQLLQILTFVVLVTLQVDGAPVSLFAAFVVVVVGVRVAARPDDDQTTTSPSTSETG